MKQDLFDFGQFRTLKEAIGLFFLYSLPFLAVFICLEILVK